MVQFTYAGTNFEGRQNEVNNIVWLAGCPDESMSMPRSFTFEEVAQYLLDIFYA